MSEIFGSGDDLESALLCLRGWDPETRIIGNVSAATLIELLESCIVGKLIAGTINETGEWEPMISIPVSEYEELREKAAIYDDLHNEGFVKTKDL